MRKKVHQPELHRFSLFVTFLTWILITAGGLVTSTGSGLSVPDWPLSYGQLMPPMVGGVRFEHSHRMIAGVVALLTFILAVWLWRAEERVWTRRLGLSLAVLVTAQAVLGGVTVLYLLPKPISVLHAIIAQLFFVLQATVSLTTSKWWMEGPKLAYNKSRHADSSYRSLIRLTCWTLSFVFIQLALGAALRHSVLTVHTHVANAVLVIILALALFSYVNRHHAQESEAWSISLFLCLATLGELFLGVGAWVSRPIDPLDFSELPPVSVLLRTAHVSVGALVLASSALLFLVCLRLRYLLRNSKVGRAQ